VKKAEGYGIVQVTHEERTAGALGEGRFTEALRTFRDAGLVVLEGVYDPAWVADLRRAFDRALKERMAAVGGLKGVQQTAHEKNHLSFYPPLVPPFSDPQIVLNPIATQVMEGLLGGDLRCTYYHSNTSYPGSGTQGVHRDSGLLFGPEVSVPLPVTHLVLNVPLCDFTEANGSTEVWPGTHLIVDHALDDRGKLAERAAALASIRTNVPLGSLILRDLRTWHRGMPNRTRSARTMLALVYRRGWTGDGTRLDIPQETWDGWPERARRIFRGNAVIKDIEEQPCVSGQSS